MSTRYELRVLAILSGLLTAGVAMASCSKRSSDPESNPSAAAVESPGESSKTKPDTAQKLIGQSPPEWQVGEWAGSAPIALADLRDQVVFVRFWTDTCPYCKASLPAMQTLADEFAGQPVKFIALYHSKPRGSRRSWAQAVATAREWGATFALGYDHDWKTVEEWWLKHNEQAATSASFVIDRKGRFAHVHPGPIFEVGDASYNAIREAIRSSLGE